MKRSWIKLFMADRGYGVHRTTCPTCQGGSTSEKTLVVSHYDRALTWYCHRASCEERGSTKSTGVPAEGAAKASRLKPYQHQSYMCSMKDKKYFWDRFRIGPEYVDLYVRRTSPAESTSGNYLFPVLGPMGRKRGIVMRKPVWKGLEPPMVSPERAGPKALTYMSKEGPTMAWYGPSASKTIVLVEDQVSAMCVGYAGYRGVALLGTHLSHERVREIQQQSPKVVALALDNDATDLALKLGQRWGQALPGFRIVLLNRDLKDCEDIEGELAWVRN